MRGIGYTRIEAERAGRRGGYTRMTFGTIDDVTDARAKGPHAEGGQARTKPPYARAQTRAGNQIALQKKKEKLRAITRSRQGGTKRKEQRDGG